MDRNGTGDNQRMQRRQWVPYVPSRRSYPQLSDHLRAAWEQILPSRDGRIEYRPCQLTLADGSTVDCAYVIDAQSYIDVWGVWPEDDPGKRSVPIESVVAISESMYRLPAPIADDLYRAGESGMGYTIFTLRFNDGSERAYASGTAIDFVRLPARQSMTDIAAVVPHAGRDAGPWRTSEYAWCLFGDGESSTPSASWPEGR